MLFALPRAHALLQLRQQEVVVKLIDTLHITEHLRHDVLREVVERAILTNYLPVKYLQHRITIKWQEIVFKSIDCCALKHVMEDDASSCTRDVNYDLNPKATTKDHNFVNFVLKDNQVPRIKDNIPAYW